MLSRQLNTVIKTQLRAYISSKAFLWSTLILPVVMFAIIFVQMSLTSMESKEQSAIGILSDDQNLLEQLKPAMSELEEVKDGLYTMSYDLVQTDDVTAYIDKSRADLLKDSNNGYFYIPASAREDKKINYYSNNPGNQDVRKNITAVINHVLNRDYFSNKPVAQEDIDYAVQDIEINGIKVSQQGAVEQSYGNHIAGFAMAILLMLSMFIIAMPFSAIIIDEKMSRSVEVLLTSVSARELLTGKIISATIAGLTQMLIWLMPLFILMLDTSVLSIPDKYQPDLGIGTVLFFLLNYILGLTIIMSLWGGLSAMFDTGNDAAAAMFPLTMLMWMPFYAVFSLIKNPANSVAEILSITPFTSQYVMPLRMAIIDVPIWQPLLALGLNVLLLYGAMICGGKIYRISILSTGQRPGMKQFIHWLRYA